MKLPQTGGCQCGKIRYEISETPQSRLCLSLSGLPTADQQRLLNGYRGTGGGVQTRWG